MKMNNRATELEKNFKRMFWIQAFMSFKILNVVISIFYVHRGLTLQQIFFLGIVFAVTNLVFEIPSSYMADKWGRKKTIFFAVLFLALSSVFDFISHSFLLFTVDLVCYGMSYAFLSGTDDALIYDTSRELGRGAQSLKELGSYYSAQRFFKIVTPLIGVLIAKDLVEWQFQIIIVLEFLTTLIALPLVLRLVEPRHHVEVERMEAGIILDAWRLIQKNVALIQVMLNRTIIFIASFLVWRIHQQYFVTHGISIWTLGFMWVFINGVGYVLSKKVAEIFPQWSAAKKINVLNSIFTITLCIFALGSFFKAPAVLVIFYALGAIAEVVRWPLFSNIFNEHSKSFNRATTLSLTNFIKSVLDIPLTLTAAWLIGFNPSYMFVFAALIACVTLLLIPVREHAPAKLLI